MAKLSKAAQGNRRGALEIAESIPALFTHMETGAFSRAAPAIATWTPLVITAGIASLFVIPEAIAFFLILPLACVGIALIGSLLEVGSDMKKPKVIRGLRSAAEDAVNGEDVSISEYIQYSVEYSLDGEQYVEKLNERQQRWIAKRWEKEFNDAAARSTEPDKKVAASIDALLDTDRAQSIAYHKKALEELKSSSQKKADAFTEFDKQLRAQHP